MKWALKETGTYRSMIMLNKDSMFSRPSFWEIEKKLKFFKKKVAIYIILCYFIRDGNL
jgi:hypothetical protein